MAKPFSDDRQPRPKHVPGHGRGTAWKADAVPRKFRGAEGHASTKGDPEAAWRRAAAANAGRKTGGHGAPHGGAQGRQD